jgi:hypothetical protein
MRLTCTLFAALAVFASRCSGDKHVKRIIPNSWPDGGVLPSDTDGFCYRLCNLSRASGCSVKLKGCAYLSDDAGPDSIAIDCNEGDGNQEICD